MHTHLKTKQTEILRINLPKKLPSFSISVYLTPYPAIPLPYLFFNPRETKYKIEINLQMTKLPLRAVRPIPKSLLRRQAQRTNPNQLANNERAALLLSSLRDIPSLVLSSSVDDEVEELEAKRGLILSKYDSGELTESIKSDYCTKSKDILCDYRLLLSKYPLNSDQASNFEIVFDSLHSKDWNSIPLIWKQLWFYHSFGSWGPRKGLDFCINKKPQDFFIRDSIGLIQCSQSRKDEFEKIKRSDPSAKFILGFAALVSLLAGYNDWMSSQDSKLEQEDEVLI